MHCPNCGAANPNQQACCLNCGAQLQAPGQLNSAGPGQPTQPASWVAPGTAPQAPGPSRPANSTGASLGGPAPQPHPPAVPAPSQGPTAGWPGQPGSQPVPGTGAAQPWPPREASGPPPQAGVSAASNLDWARQSAPSVQGQQARKRPVGFTVLIVAVAVVLVGALGYMAFRVFPAGGLASDPTPTAAGPVSAEKLAELRDSETFAGLAVHLYPETTSSLCEASAVQFEGGPLWGSVQEPGWSSTYALVGLIAPGYDLETIYQERESCEDEFLGQTVVSTTDGVSYRQIPNYRYRFMFVYSNVYFELYSSEQDYDPAVVAAEFKKSVDEMAR